MSKVRPFEEPIGRAEYRRWAVGRRERFERIAGHVVTMPPERAAHVRVKTAVWLALRNALRAAKIDDCEALGDGVTIEIGEHTDYEPDAMINRAARLSDDALAATNPLLVVEVISPSSEGSDTGAKLADYFSVPTIEHYLIVHPTKRQVVHHRRRDGMIETRIVGAGALTLDPPGIVVAIEEFYV